MKKVFLFLMSALVCGIMTSCSKDDDGVALTNIRVDPASFSKPVGETQQITVKAIPDNATGVTYTWSSSNVNVATVSASGLITVTGIGTATVTVTSGTISADVAVTGTLKGITVVDASGASVGTYPFTDGQEDPVEFTLTATVDPANSGIKPTWSVDVSTVTVAASADGLSATVTISGEGTAVVSVTAGGVTATYTISTSSLLETANGYWTFDDPQNLFAATIGEGLTPGGWDDAEAEISPAAGPTATNGAASVPKFTYLLCRHGISGNGERPADTDAAVVQRVNEYTLMWDVFVEERGKYYALFENELKDDLTVRDEAAFYLKPGGNLGGGSFSNSPEDLYQAATWHRVVLTAKFASEGGFYAYYLDGVKVHSGTTDKGFINHGRYSIKPNGVAFFADARPGISEGGDSGYDFNDGLSVAGIAIWDHPLTDAEVAALGAIAVNE